MPPLKSWPEWIKALLTAAVASLVTVFGLGVRDGARQASADATARLAVETKETIDRDIQPRLRVTEAMLAAQAATLTGITTRLDDILAELRRK